MIERKYVEYELAKGKKDICIVCNCKNAETLNTFLCSDVNLSHHNQASPQAGLNPSLTTRHLTELLRFIRFTIP